MNIEYIIKNINDFSDEATIYAEKLGGEWTSDSEAVVLQLTEDEMYLGITEISKKYAPDKEYFLEVFLIKELLEGDMKVDKKIIDRVIYYAENDA